MSNDTIRLEEQLAHQEKTVQDLSDVVADQARRIQRLERQLLILMEREAEREFEAGGQVPLADQKPPHW
ncbi:SlyX family protein [Pseudothioclava arenosa]|uniref:SlyX protein n=1 Tax=Pseudothioclava arenosa TaxID=1795308 RepID=A0A2A4CUB0_9RHOB|nr:SlyX family protein [Pseudothioclava arenosa]PCD78077.1 SlyX protein [Pseudothioclava arenosa]